MDKMIPRMVTIKEAAAATGLAEYHVRQLCKNGKISTVKTGKKYLVNLDRFIDYLNAPPVPTTGVDNAVRSISKC